ncbi:MAG TPA: hypothetical protein VGR20_16070 [Acidimicrobiia bacterium]|nr:hypothetical protein [Acidimicrobiia bacterium]
MIRVHRRPLRLVAAVLAFGLLGAACGSTSSANGKVDESTTTTTIAKGPDTTAAQLRSKLNGVLAEHVYLASAATGAALGGRADEFTAAAAALEGNSDALTGYIAAVFGAEAGKAFDPLWKKHVTLFMAYAQGLAAHDGGKAAQAVSDLNAYTKDFGAFINSALPALPADTVAGLVATHVQTLKAVVDAQSAGNETEAFNDQRTAAAHMATLVTPLVGAIAKANPDKIGGDPASKAADFVNTLNGVLREHVFLVSAATGAALGGRDAEFKAATATLDANSDAVTDAIASVYGPEAGTAFAPLWKKHIGFLVDYTMALANKQQAKADEAMGNLLQYTEDFGAFINTASPKLTKDAVAELIKTHVFTLKDIIDAQAAKNYTKAYAGERTAADHMTLIANGLATTVVAQFPTKF